MNRLSASAAAALVQSGHTVACAGFVGAGHAEAITAAIEQRFLAHGLPRDVCLVYGAGQGDRVRRGVNHFGHPGLVRRVIGGHWISAPRLGQLVRDNAIEAYNLPQGVITHLFRAIAGGHPGLLSPIGLHTFVDPRHGGGALTPRSPPLGIEVLTLAGREQLFYPGFKIDVALLRATSADERGNLSTEHEAFHQDLLSIAQAARNSGGIVIAQVKRVLPNGSLNPNLVRVPGILVDHVVVTEDADDHWMTYGERFNETYIGGAPLEPAGVTGMSALEAARAAQRAEAQAGTGPAGPPAATDPQVARHIIQRRAALELATLRAPVVNLGVGMPAGVGAAARALGLSDFTLTVESGPIGGTPADKLSFGASAWPEAIIDQAAMFDFYDGGGLDIALLGMAEFDAAGSVNVSRFGSTVAGVGGFINITQSTRRLVFMGTLTAGGLEVEAKAGGLHIVREGRVKKLVPRLQHLSFNGPYAARQGTQVRYVTERAVFELRQGELELIEVAPGLDLQREVLDQLGAPVRVAPDCKLMDARLFGGG